VCLWGIEEIMPNQFNQNVGEYRKQVCKDSIIPLPVQNGTKSAFKYCVKLEKISRMNGQKQWEY
jgi:hypothetical protein